MDKEGHISCYFYGDTNCFCLIGDASAFCNNNIFSLTQEEATNPWGVHVDRVEIKDVRLPQQLQRAMAAEAEATREARAKVIAAEGERDASESLKEAAKVIQRSPQALQVGCNC